VNDISESSCKLTVNVSLQKAENAAAAAAAAGGVGLGAGKKTKKGGRGGDLLTKYP
jgi:hypothetical protein